MRQEEFSQLSAHADIVFKGHNLADAPSFQQKMMQISELLLGSGITLSIWTNDQQPNRFLVSLEMGEYRKEPIGTTIKHEYNITIRQSLFNTLETITLLDDTPEDCPTFRKERNEYRSDTSTVTAKILISKILTAAKEMMPADTQEINALPNLQNSTLPVAELMRYVFIPSPTQQKAFMTQGLQIGYGPE